VCRETVLRLEEDHLDYLVDLRREGGLNIISVGVRARFLSGNRLGRTKFPLSLRFRAPTGSPKAV
jgi:hypothetical protein